MAILAELRNRGAAAGGGGGVAFGGLSSMPGANPIPRIRIGMSEYVD